MSFPSVENTGSLPTDLLMPGAVPSVENVGPLNWLTYHFSVENTAFWKDLENMALPTDLLMSGAVPSVENVGPLNWLTYVWSCPLCGECWTSQLTYLSLFCGEHSLLKRLREYGPPSCLTYVCILCREYGQKNCCTNWGHKKINKQMLQIELKALLHFIKMARLACGIRLCNTSSPSLKTRD